MVTLDIRELERRLIECKRARGIAGRLKPSTGGAAYSVEAPTAAGDC